MSFGADVDAADAASIADGVVTAVGVAGGAAVAGAGASIPTAGLSRLLWYGLPLRLPHHVLLTKQKYPSLGRHYIDLVGRHFH